MYLQFITINNVIFHQKLNLFYLTDAQKHPPIITFGKPDVVVGGLLRANCTSAPAAPAPKLTWYIDNEKVINHYSPLLCISLIWFSYQNKSASFLCKLT